MTDKRLHDLLRAASARTAKSPHPMATPSARDQQIFHRVEILCERQCAVALELRLTPSRVSQIVRRVRRWLASGAPGDSQTLAALEQRCLERTLAQARHLAIYQHLMREVARQENNARLTTVRTTDKPDEKPTVVTTVREQRLNVQLLKAAQRSVTELDRLAQRDSALASSAAELTEGELYDALFRVLYDLREAAQDTGRVARCPNVYLLVQSTLKAVLGSTDDDDQPAPDSHQPPTSADCESTSPPPASVPFSPLESADSPASPSPTPHSALPAPHFIGAKHEPALGSSPAAADASTSADTNSSPPTISGVLPVTSSPAAPPRAARKKTPILSPPPPGSVMFGRPDNSTAADPTPPPDDRIPVVLHGWTPPDRTPFHYHA